ncbi:MAG: homocitrate synthase [Chloroflexi bacterium]|nr:homocitrate synthase [Chloroflexota bacterium]
MPVIHFIDVTNRDAAQAARISLAKLQKTMINVYLGQMGVYQSEFAFPFTRHELNYIKANLELQEMGALGSLVLEGWCRAMVSDVAKSWPSGVRHLNLSASVSDQMIRNKYHGRLDRRKIIEEMVEAVAYAKSQGIQTIGVNGEDASRADMGYVAEFCGRAKEAGAHRFRYCDTLGYDSPMSIYHRVRSLAEQVKMPIELHCHNDLGMGVADSVAGAMGAIDGGVDAYINTSINGLGERAGQADLLGCLLAVKFAQGLEKYAIGDNIDLKVAYRLARYTSYAFGIPLPINQPGVGANAFAHEAGVHADGALKDRRNYELYDYELLGIPEEEKVHSGRVITTGEYGGMAGLKYVYARLGISFDSDVQAESVLELVRHANGHTQLPLTEDELRFIAQYPEQVRKILTVTP